MSAPRQAVPVWRFDEQTACQAFWEMTNSAYMPRQRDAARQRFHASFRLIDAGFGDAG